MGGELGLDDSYCIVQTQKIHANYPTNNKMIYLKSDTRDNMRVFCARIKQSDDHKYYSL